MTGNGIVDVEMLLDVPHPGDVGVRAVDGEAEKLHTAAPEVRGDLGELDELGRADGSEVRRMGEEDQPTPLEVLQPKGAMGRLRLKRRRRHGRGGGETVR